MTSPFRIEGPAVVSFSGGRTSAYMLRRILDEGLLPDVHVLFANTGKERPETLDFVEECATRWRVRVRWLERLPGGAFAEVTHANASRQGEPFTALIAEKKYLPNPITRFCTGELKVGVLRRFMEAQGYSEWLNVTGLRADEPARVARMRSADRAARSWEDAMPLADAGVTEADVLAFWKDQPFNLALRPWEGNCDLCFLKGQNLRRRIMQDRPNLAAWWVEQERRLSARFRGDSPSYAALLDATRRQLALFTEADDSLGDCVCNDTTGEAA